MDIEVRRMRAAARAAARAESDAIYRAKVEAAIKTNGLKKGDRVRIKPGAILTGRTGTVTIILPDCGATPHYFLRLDGNEPSYIEYCRTSTGKGYQRTNVPDWHRDELEITSEVAE